MFSPRYVEALRGVVELEPTDADQLEQQLAKDPHDFQSRLKLLAYYARADRADRPEDLRKRIQHVLWLIENDPESDILHSYVSQFAHGQLTPADYQRAVALWHTAAGAHPGNAAVLWNAASFFRALDQGLQMDYLEATAAADPQHPFALRPLAHFYALSILEGGPLASRAKAALEASSNVWILGNAAYMLQSQYNTSVQRHLPNRRAAELAERYFLRAKAIDPNLDRSKILPQLDMEAVAKAHQDAARVQQEWELRAAHAGENIRRLPVDSFPELPQAVAGMLRARSCRVPQPSPNGTPRNVIRGEFFSQGRVSWAVLCSVGNSTDLIVFRGERDTNPVVLNHTDDRGYLQLLDQDQALYSREITAVDRDFIMNNYRASGGPEPPPIRHHGIDDAFLEKASVTWYYDAGKWLQLQGAD